MADERCFESASWMAAAIRDGRASSAEITAACLDRIEAVNPRLNAVVRLAGDAVDRHGICDVQISGTVGVVERSFDGERVRLVAIAGTMGYCQALNGTGLIPFRFGTNR